MGTLGNPKIWEPYMHSKECTQQICSLSCPQWCYIIFPPPPPLVLPIDKSQPNLTFSPLVIAVIGSLASAFLLVCYYAIISKFCGNSCSSRRGEIHSPNEEIEQEDSHNNYNHHNHEFSQHEPWFIRTNGLDEAVIKSITLVKYKKGVGLIGVTNCLICLGEFLEDDNLRLLPKCSHAFHVACIDTWLKFHSNCPLCRANIMSISISVQPVHPTPPQDHLSLSENQAVNEEVSSSRENRRNLLKRPFRSLSDLALWQSSHVSYVTHYGGTDVIRRSNSMDHSHEISVSISEL